MLDGERDGMKSRHFFVVLSHSYWLSSFSCCLHFRCVFLYLFIFMYLVVFIPSFWACHPFFFSWSSFYGSSSYMLTDSLRMFSFLALKNSPLVAWDVLSFKYWLAWVCKPKGRVETVTSFLITFYPKNNFSQ